MGRRLLLLVEDTQRHGDAIKELQREVRELASAVERLAYEVHRVRESSEHQHEVTKLELKNEMLRFRQQLPAEPGSVEKPESWKPYLNLAIEAEANYLVSRDKDLRIQMSG